MTTEPQDTPTETVTGSWSDDNDTDTQEGTQAVTDAHDGPSGPDEGVDEQEDIGKAARLRRRAQAAETERDTLAAHLATARRQIAEQASGLAHPHALWAAGTSVDDLYREDGTLDTDALTTASNTATTMLGTPRRPKPDPSAGSTHAETAVGWAEVFRKR